MFTNGIDTPFDVVLSSSEPALFVSRSHSSFCKLLRRGRTAADAMTKFAASTGQSDTCKFLIDTGADAQLANKYPM
jgi:hypothetical protein